MSDLSDIGYALDGDGQQLLQGADDDEPLSQFCLEYITRMALQHAPRNQEEYLQRDNHTWLLPDPILLQQRAAAAGDLQLATEAMDPIALYCAGTSVTELVWHWDTVLASFCCSCYPTQRVEPKSGKARAISKCSKCQMPKWVPDESRPGHLKENKQAHRPECPRATNTYVHASGKKAGQVAANYSYKK